MSALDSTARHVCHCGKSFIRKEHLTRHQATHDKPAYVCNVCQRHFSRKDLLRRHSVLHEASHTRMVVSCEACRANKTKCSGGTRCSLCTRRGIDCIYRGGLRQTGTASRSNNSEAAVDASASEDIDHDGDDESMLPTSSRTETSLGQELLQRNVRFLKNLTIVSSQPNIRSGSPPLRQGVEGIYELLIAGKPPLEAAIAELNGMKERISKYIETYIEKFHLRWPILHAPTLNTEIETMPLAFAASLCLIGAWFQDCADRTERCYALRVHEILLERLLHGLIEPELLSSAEQAWPIEIFQAVLLVLIFSLYRTDKSVLSRAVLLRSTFITVLRDLGIFDAEKLAAHLQTYYSGTYAPYTLAMREKFRRLLISTYQFDTYLALAHGKPPLLHSQEVGVCLPSSFALWNAYGLDVFARRQLDEPSARSSIKVSELANRSDMFASSKLLVEDVQLGLYGALQATWVLTQGFPSNKTKSPIHKIRTSLLTQTLDDWKQELDKIQKLTDLENVTTNDAARYLLLAYRGEDDSAAASLGRITTLVQDGMILYYYLKMSHYVSEVIGPGRRIEDSQTETWQTSKYGREALICALQMLKMGESRVSLNPLIRHGLAIGVDVARVSLSGQRCRCLRKESQRAGNRHLQQWSDTDGPVRIDGTPLCVCKLTFWTERFEKVIQGQQIMVE